MITTRFNAPYFTGSSQSQLVPGLFDVALNGRPFMVDTKYADQFRRQPIELLRRQADQSPTFGEQTLSPEDAIRRSQDSWDHGAGQSYLDREDSDPRRFHTSKGVDIWERWALSLLPDTEVKKASVAPTVLLEPAGAYLYCLDGGTLSRTADLTGTPTWTAITGVPATGLSVASDGYTVFTAHGGAGVYSTQRVNTSGGAYNALPATLLGYCRGRLMAANGSSIYNITSGTTPTALFTHPNVDFSWVGFAEGTSVIYAAGFSGDKSLIYRIGLTSDGTSLDAPVVAGQLPDGEVVRGIMGYLGYVLLGSDKGVRLCATGTNGSLTLGPLIRTPQPVRCFEGQARYVWFGWSNYDATSTGLGRLDLGTFNAVPNLGPYTPSLYPAYASDLMVTGQGAVQSVVTYGDKLVLSVAGQGVFGQSANKVPTGTLETGRIAYGISDSKIALFLDIRLRDALGSHAAAVSVDGGGFTQVGSGLGLVDNDMAFQVGQVAGESFEVRLTLGRDATPTLGPTLSRFTLRAYPRPARGQQFTIPLDLHEQVVNRADATYYQDPTVELEAILALQDNRRLVVLQSGAQSYTVLVDNSVFIHDQPTRTGRGWNGTLLVVLKALAN